MYDVEEKISIYFENFFKTSYFADKLLIGICQESTNCGPRANCGPKSQNLQPARYFLANNTVYKT